MVKAIPFNVLNQILRTKIITKENPLPRADHVFIKINKSAFVYGGSKGSKNLIDLADIEELNLGLPQFISYCFERN